MRRRARTCEAPSQDLDMMVLAFECSDSSMFTMMGKNSKEMKWKVAAMGTESMSVKLNVEKIPGGSCRVTVKENEKIIFPQGGKDAGASGKKLSQDFEHRWPFRGKPVNLDKIDHWEVKPKQTIGCTGNDWFIASKINQRMDGTFEGGVWLPDPVNGWKLFQLPLIAVEDIREAKTKEPINIPVREVVLTVPKDKPLSDTSLVLRDDKGAEEEITHFFARVTPPSGRGSLESVPGGQGIVLEVVDKAKTKIRGAATHTELDMYLKGEVFSVDYKPESKTKATWKIAIADGVHTISIERKHKTHRTMTLTVDGSTLVEAKAKDFDIDYDGEDEKDDDDAPWECRFFFIGDRSVKFKVFEETRSGIQLESMEVVEGLSHAQRRFKRACSVCISDVRDLRKATLRVDDIPFSDFKELQKKREEPINLDCEIFTMQYGLQIPKKIREEPPPGLAGVQQKWIDGMENFQAAVGAAQTGGIGGFFSSIAQGAKGAGKGGYAAS